MSKEAPERPSESQNSVPISPECEISEIRSAEVAPSHVSEQAVFEHVEVAKVAAVVAEAAAVAKVVASASASAPLAAEAEAEREAEAESGVTAPTASPEPESSTAPAVLTAPDAETTVATLAPETAARQPEAATTEATPAPEIAARQMLEMWENLGKGYKADWQKQDIGIDIAGRPTKRQKLKQKQQNPSTTGHDEQGASAMHTDTGKDGTESQKKPGEGKLQKMPSDGDTGKSLSEISRKPEQSTVQTNSDTGKLKGSSRQACGQWMPKGGRCSQCRGKTVDEFGGVVCRRRRVDGTETGCHKGLCWRCMKPTPGDEIGKIRTTKRDFQALGKRAWWLHESCMSTTDEADYFLLIMPTPT